MRNGKQIHLPENNEAGHHDHHGRLCISHASERPRVYLIDTQRKIERHFKADKQRAIGQDVRALVK